MTFFEAHGFLTILIESIKLLRKNGKLIAFIAILSIILSSTSLFLFFYFFESLMADTFVTSQQSFMPDPSSTLTLETSLNPAQIASHLRQDSALLISLEISFCISFATIFFFSAISTIILSSVSYSGKNLSLKELLLKIRTTWVRSLITTFYASGTLTIGYFVFVITMLTPLLPTYPKPAILFIMAILLAIIALIFYLYLFVAWGLAIVVSVVEETCYGIKALRKATLLVEGKRLHGFLLIICSNFVVFIILQGYKMLLGNKGFMNPKINLLFSVSVSILVEIFLVVAYTVLYFECKKHHGEEIELHGSLEYTKVPSHDKLANDMP
ncbi:hypothetical protein CDL12_09112 [Handroanthus impetiginosus]|uniref:Transmembrane protein n=1 Tax=Handroanthus impetiginosus TaxID=429701 RepID=A0A2G9HL15_9LAMI|nr:hypothetical protein CDL12_09112 [Handroanthus impetiginosus]